MKKHVLPVIFCFDVPIPTTYRVRTVYKQLAVNGGIPSAYPTYYVFKLLFFVQFLTYGYAAISQVIPSAPRVN